MNPASLLQQAVALHQQGRYAAAQDLYRQVLDHDPRNFDALHLSGVAARQLGQPEAGAALITQALALDPGQPSAHCNLGAALQDAGHTEAALASYERAIALKPDYALACSNRGNALRKLGRLEEALLSYEQALRLKPDYPEAWCNRALALLDLGRAGEALHSAEQSLDLRPRHADAWCARANALQELERFDDALACYDHAIALRPDWAQAHCSRGTALQRIKRHQEALDSYQRAIALQPHYPLAHQYRGNALRSLGRREQAIAAYTEALDQGGDERQIGYALAALGVGDTPAAPPSGYVQALFDQYAGHFDRHLVDVLEYRMPEQLDALLRRHLGAHGGEHAPEPGSAHGLEHGVAAGMAQGLDIADLGCGTGLCAPLLRPLARTLDGVDLSHHMLEKARQRALYDHLACADLNDFLAGRDNQYDVLLAADVLVYLGELAPVFALAWLALRPGGYFCFSVEAGEGRDYQLRPSHRYAHSLDYLQRLAASHGFEIVEAGQLAARLDQGLPVQAHALLLRSLKRAP